MLRKTAKADWRRNDRPIKEEGYVTDLLAREAARSSRAHDPSVPLLLMVSFNTPAQFYGAPKAFLDQYRDVPDDTRRSYAAAVTALDAAWVPSSRPSRSGRCWTTRCWCSRATTAAPCRCASRPATGMWTESAADNGIFREGRGSLYEGGVRVVALMSWPGKIKPKTIVTEPLHVTDLYVTLLKLAGASLEQPKKLDGVDVWPVIADGQRTHAQGHAAERGGLRGCDPGRRMEADRAFRAAEHESSCTISPMIPKRRRTRRAPIRIA